MSGAYVLCLLYQSRVHQYRILPGKDGKLSIQTEGERETSYSELHALISIYMSKEMKNGLVYALKFPLSPERDDDMDSDEDEEESHPIPASPSVDSISESLDIFQNRMSTELLQNYSKLDLSSCDDDLKKAIKMYIETGFKKDISTSDGSAIPEFQKIMELASVKLHRELDLYKKKLMIFSNLFDLVSVKFNRG